MSYLTFATMMNRGAPPSGWVWGTGATIRTGNYTSGKNFSPTANNATVRIAPGSTVVGWSLLASYAQTANNYIALAPGDGPGSSFSIVNPAGTTLISESDYAGLLANDAEANVPGCIARTNMSGYTGIYYTPNALVGGPIPGGPYTNNTTNYVNWGLNINLAGSNYQTSTFGNANCYLYLWFFDKVSTISGTGVTAQTVTVTGTTSGASGTVPAFPAGYQLRQLQVNIAGTGSLGAAVVTIKNGSTTVASADITVGITIDTPSGDFVKAGYGSFGVAQGSGMSQIIEYLSVTGNTASLDASTLTINVTSTTMSGTVSCAVSAYAVPAS